MTHLALLDWQLSMWMVTARQRSSEGIIFSGVCLSIEGPCTGPETCSILLNSDRTVQGPSRHTTHTVNKRAVGIRLKSFLVTVLQKENQFRFVGLWWDAFDPILWQWSYCWTVDLCDSSPPVTLLQCDICLSWDLWGVCSRRLSQAEAEKLLLQGWWWCGLSLLLRLFHIEQFKTMHGDATCEQKFMLERHSHHMRRYFPFLILKSPCNSFYSNIAFKFALQVHTSVWKGPSRLDTLMFLTGCQIHKIKFWLIRKIQINLTVARETVLITS